MTTVQTTSNGYIISFSDGSSATISNGIDGKDGINGTNAPVISVKLDSDGNYYWTIDGEWLLVNGSKVRANGIDGEDGKDGVDGKDGENGADAVAPKVRINENSKEWEISTDGGDTWISTGIIAEGKDGSNGTTDWVNRVAVKDGTKEFELQIRTEYDLDTEVAYNGKIAYLKHSNYLIWYEFD